jgi:hypothetical protein
MTDVAKKPANAAIKGRNDLVLKIGDMVLPLEFADTATDPKFKQAVALDLELIYGHLTGHEVISGGASSAVIVRGQPITPRMMVNITGKGRYFPKEIESDFGYVGAVNGHDAILITDKIIAAYVEAMDRQREQPKAFYELSRFVETMNNLATSPVINPGDLFYLDPSIASAKAEIDGITPQLFVQNFGSKQYRSPSVLEVIDGMHLGEHYEGRLIAKLYIKTSDGIDDSMPPIIFDGGQWKFLIHSSPM